MAEVTAINEAVSYHLENCKTKQVFIISKSALESITSVNERLLILELRKNIKNSTFVDQSSHWK